MYEYVWMYSVWTVIIMVFLFSNCNSMCEEHIYKSIMLHSVQNMDVVLWFDILTLYELTSAHKISTKLCLTLENPFHLGLQSKAICHCVFLHCSYWISYECSFPRLRSPLCSTFSANCSTILEIYTARDHGSDIWLLWGIMTSAQHISNLEKPSCDEEQFAHSGPIKVRAIRRFKTEDITMCQRFGQVSQLI